KVREGADASGDGLPLADDRRQPRAGAVTAKNPGGVAAPAEGAGEAGDERHLTRIVDDGGGITVQVGEVAVAVGRRIALANDHAEAGGGGRAAEDPGVVVLPRGGVRKGSDERYLPRSIH